MTTRSLTVGVKKGEEGARWRLTVASIRLCQGGAISKRVFYYADNSWLAKSQRRQPLPPTLERHRAELDSFVQKCADVARKVLQGLALALDVRDPQVGADASWIQTSSQKRTTESECLPLEQVAEGRLYRLRLLHYPPVPVSHTDDPQL